MFEVNRGGDHRTYHNNNSAPATLKLLAFLFVVGLVGAIGWAFLQAVEQVTTAMGRTWTTGNNDHLISGWNTLVIVGGLVVIVLIVLAILPWLVHNWRTALSGGRSSQGDHWQVSGPDPYDALPNPPPAYGLLTDGDHEEKFIDVPSANALPTIGGTTWT